MTTTDNQMEIADGVFIDIELAGPDDFRKAIALENARAEQHEMIAAAIAGDEAAGRSFDNLNAEARGRFGVDVWDCTRHQLLEMYEGRGIVPAGLLAKERRGAMHLVGNRHESTTYAPGGDR